MITEITNEQQLKDTIDTHEGKVVVLFTAPAWCGPCQKFEPQFELASTLTDILFVRIDIDKNMWFNDWAVRAVPTIQLWSGGQYELVKPASAATFAQSLQE